MTKVHPDLHSGARRVPRIVLSPWKVRVTRRLFEVLRPSVLTSGLSIEDRPVPGASTMMRIYRPESVSGPLPVVLWIHGGGLVVGSYKEDGWASQFIAGVDVAVVSVGYRLAPEHPFPAGLDDLAAAFQWVTFEGHQYGLDSDRICIAGESAGGGLAAALVQRLHDDGVDVRGQLLVYPMLDDRTAARSDIKPKEHLVWTNGSNRFGWASYLGTDPGGESTPEYAVPARRQDLSGLPPAWIGIGDLDLFYGESIDYGARLRAAGVDCKLELVPGAPHAFPMLSPKAQVSKDFVSSAIDFVKETLRAT